MSWQNLMKIHSNGRSFRIYMMSGFTTAIHWAAMTSSTIWELSWEVTPEKLYPEASSEGVLQNKCVRKNFTNFTGKRLKVCNLIKKRLQHRCFPMKSEKFIGTPIVKSIGERLLLYTDLSISNWNFTRMICKKTTDHQCPLCKT